MKKLSIYILLLVTLASCTDKSKDSEVYFGGEIVNPKTNFVLLMQHEKVIDTLYLEPDFSFGKHFVALAEGLYSFKHGYEYQHVYLNPKDSIRIRLNTWDFDETLVFYGKGAEKNEFLMNIFLENEKTKYYSYYKLPEIEFVSKLDNKAKEYHLLLNHLKENNKLTAKYLHLAKASIDYPFFRLKEIYPYKHKNYVSTEDFSVSESYYDYRNDVNLNDEDLVEFYAYKNYISTYVYNVAYQKDSFTGFNADFRNTVLKIISKKIKIPRLKNKMLTDEIYYSIRNTTLPLAESFELYVSNCTDSVAVSRIKLLLEEKNQLQVGDRIPDFEVSYHNEVKDIKEIINNKHTVVNFWTAKAISIDYLENRMQFLRRKFPSIRFISINIDDKHAAYTKILKNKNDRFYLPQTSNGNNFVKSNYPRSILINKQGNIVNGFAMLTNQDFVAKLEAMLKENKKKLPKGFVYVTDVIPSVQVALRYAGSNNFIGKPIDGYNSSELILSEKATLALQEVQKALKKEGLGLKIFDGYRPQRAVNHFIRWAKDINDTLQKKAYYPNIDKRLLFKKGFIASRSGHSRGSTVDLTLVDLNTNEEIDMGSPFDFFGAISSVKYTKITKEQQQNRQILQRVMKKHNFRPYHKEWWHFTLRNEPFKKTYFDFMVE